MINLSPSANQVKEDKFSPWAREAAPYSPILFDLIKNIKINTHIYINKLVFAFEQAGDRKRLFWIKKYL